MRKLIIKSFILLVFSFIFFETNSFDIKDLGKINSYVIDKTQSLNTQEKNQIQSKIQELREKFTVEILLVLLPSTNGEDISMVGTQIGQEVGVGKKDKDNGVVILIAIEDREWNISTGYGIEGVLPDLLANDIGEKNFAVFKDGKYFEGIIGCLNDFDNAFLGKEIIISKQKDKYSNKGLYIDYIGIFFVFGLIFIVFSSFFLKKKLNEGNYTEFFIYFLIFFGITLLIVYYLFKDIIISFLINLFLWIIGLSGKGGGSGGGFSGRGSGGFGGFGGGRFGGGGSSGRW